jgi:adenosylhomocysteine nucleosidase
MSREVEPLVRGARKTRLNGMDCFELEAAVVVAGGVGQKAARRAAQAVITSYSPSVLISAGLAGALSERHKVGDVVSAQAVIEAGSGDRFASRGDAGLVVTSAAVSDEAAKRALATKWHADVVDMEAAAVAQVALNNCIEFAALKAVSDELSFRMPPVGAYLDEDGKFSTLRFVLFVVGHPRWWGPVRQLNTNSRTAALKLSEALPHLIERWSRVSKESKVGA